MQRSDKSFFEESRFEQIYGDHRGAVESYVRRRVSADLVEDVVADVFVVCLRRIDDVPSSPLPWLYAVARRTLANERRRRARTAPAELGIVRDPEPVGDSALAAAFAELRERDREILRLVAWEGLSLREVGAVLGCSPVTTRVRYHRAKVRLAARLEHAASFRPVHEGVMR